MIAKPVVLPHDSTKYRMFKSVTSFIIRKGTCKVLLRVFRSRLLLCFCTEDKLIKICWQALTAGEF
jgi:hypothetical protein